MFEIEKHLELLSIESGIPINRIIELYYNPMIYENNKEYFLSNFIETLKAKYRLPKEVDGIIKKNLKR